MELTVIIVNYNVKHFLYQCLVSVQQAMAGIEGEIIVIDNVSSDGSQAMLKANFPSVILIENTENVGFSKANNQGIAIAKGKYILLLNPDTLVEESTLKKCMACMEAKPEIGALGVKMMDGKGEFLPESKRSLPSPWVSFYKIFGLAHLFPRSKLFGRYHLTYLDKGQDHEIDILSGAFMWMRASALREVGYLDEDFFMYGEDIDLSYRFILAGYTNYYLSGTQILHYKGESTKKGSLNYVRVFYQAMIIFAQKHFGGASQKLFIFWIRLAVYFRASIAIFSRFFQKLAFPFFEGLSVYGIIYGIKSYWEHYVKYIEGGRYPSSFDWIAAPIYTLVFISFLLMAGAYRKPYRLPPLILATFSGFIAIATVSYIFPEINFSRAIVGLSSIFTLLFAITSRGFRNLLEKGRFFFTEPSQKRTLIVGTPEELHQAQGLLQSELLSTAHIAGKVYPDTTLAMEDALGTISQLRPLTLFYDIEEIIFCTQGLGTGVIMRLMESLSSLRVDFRILPPGADFIIGTQTIYRNKNTEYKLGRESNRRMKRAFDCIASSLFLVFFPVIFVFFKQPKAALLTLWKVLLGKKHLVGYISLESNGLPQLKPSALSMKHRFTLKNWENINPKRLDIYYAKAYSWYLDLEIVLKSWRDVS